MNFYSFFLVLPFLFTEVQFMEIRAKREDDKDYKREYTIVPTKMTWIEARDFCEQDGTSEKLAEILTYNQQRELRKFIRAQGALPKDSQSGYWLGGRLFGNSWQWNSMGDDFMNGDDGLFSAGWQFNQPDRKSRNGTIQECLEMQYIKGSKYTESLSWNDMWCDEKRAFICERKADDILPPVQLPTYHNNI